ncbi:MAG: carboxymuconolactone decarboxylase family protein [Jatrophihabitantaceae bacterium]
MSRIASGGDDDLSGWLIPRPRMAKAVGGLADAVYNHSELPLRIREIARMRIAEDNECEVCRHTREAQGEAEGADEAFYAHVLDWRDWPGYSAREQIAAEFAERFAQNHRGLREDDDFWARAHQHFGDDEILALGVCCSMWLGNGRLMRVLDVAQACHLVLHDS